MLFWTIFIIVFLAFMAGFWTQFRKHSSPSAPAAQRQNKELEEFLKTARKVTINLDDCEVKTGYDKIVDTGELGHYSLSLFDPFVMANLAMALGPEEKPREDRDFVYCRIACKSNVTGQPKTYYSSPIPKDDKTLLSLLSAQKTTTLYIDPVDPNKYWLDIRFLD